MESSQQSLDEHFPIAEGYSTDADRVGGLNQDTKTYGRSNDDREVYGRSNGDGNAYGRSEESGEVSARSDEKREGMLDENMEKAPDRSEENSEGRPDQPELRLVYANGRRDQVYHLQIIGRMSGLAKTDTASANHRGIFIIAILLV